MHDHSTLVANYSDIDNTNDSHRPIETTMKDPAVIKDPIYSFEIARRAVGRAALHLGIDSMTEQSLDVMADILLQYLGRTGRALSHLAEASRRTSMHVNVLDAFQACQLVASPAVGRLHLQEPEEEEEDEIIVKVAPVPKPIEGSSAGMSADGTTANLNGIGIGGSASASSPAAAVPSNGGTALKTKPNAMVSSLSSTGWKGLASFVFGPNWLHEKDNEEYLMELAASRALAGTTGDDANGEGGTELQSSGAGGKVFPSALPNGLTDGGDHHGGIGIGLGIAGEMVGRKRNRRKGWDAPYPDEIPIFPRASATCANPHTLPARITGGPSAAAGTAAATSSTVYRKIEVDAEEAKEDSQEALNELEALSDEVFLPHSAQEAINMKGNGVVPAVGDSAWGSIDGTGKCISTESSAAMKDEDGDVEMQPRTKKVKFGDGSSNTEAANGNNALPKSKVGASVQGTDTPNLGAKGVTVEDEEGFLYVPTFYPPPPSTKVVVDDRRTVVDGVDDRQQRLLQQQRTQQKQEQQAFATKAAIEPLEGAALSTSSSSAHNHDTLDLDSSKVVRSSLIRLGNNSYWGSGWDNNPSSSTSLAVPMGRKVGKDSGGGSSGGRVAPDDPIVPMNRASGSRVSRVLEGSMDAAAMQ